MIFDFRCVLSSTNQGRVKLSFLFQIVQIESGLSLTFSQYRSGTVNSNTVNSKFHFIRSCCEYLARFLSFHV